MKDKKKSSSCMKMVKKHVKGDVRDFKEEIKEDKKLLKDLKGKKKK